MCYNDLTVCEDPQAQSEAMGGQKPSMERLMISRTPAASAVAAVLAALLLLGSVPRTAQAGVISEEETRGLTADRITKMCAKMKPSVYAKNDEGTILRKGCRFQKGTYTIIYEVTGRDSYLNSMRTSGIVNQNARTGDQEEFAKYCKSYSWLYSSREIARKIAVEYRDPKGNLLASKYIDTRDCRTAAAAPAAGAKNPQRETGPADKKHQDRQRKGRNMP